jgi:uncharacterized protein
VRALIDTSALVKILMEEPGGDEAVDLWDGAEIVLASRLLYPEARSAVARAHRGGRLSQRQLRLARDRLEARWTEVRVVELSEDVARLAGDASEAYGLAAGDAVHLASGLVVGGVTLITWGRRLGLAAHDAGLSVAPALGPRR